MALTMRYIESITEKLNIEELKQLDYISREGCNELQCSNCILDKVGHNSCYEIPTILHKMRSKGAEHCAEIILKLYDELEGRDFIKF